MRIVWPAGAEGIQALDPRGATNTVETLVPAGGRNPQFLAMADLESHNADWWQPLHLEKLEMRLQTRLS